MKVKLERGRIVLELDGVDRTDLEVNGALQAQYFLDQPDGPEDFQKRLRNANCALAAANMMRSVVTQLGDWDKRPKTAAAYLAGFHAGLRGEHRVIGTGGGRTVVEPECADTMEHRPFREGWSTGAAFFAAVQMADGAEDPRASW